MASDLLQSLDIVLNYGVLSSGLIMLIWGLPLLFRKVPSGTSAPWFFFLPDINSIPTDCLIQLSLLV
jgi:hypothetical protein